MMQGQFGQRYRAMSRAGYDVPDLPNERPAPDGGKRLTRGWYDLTAMELDHLASEQMPRRLAGDWRTERAPAMRRSTQKPVRDADLELAPAEIRPTPEGVPAPRRGPVFVCCGPISGRGMSLEQGGHGPGERAYERKLRCGPAVEHHAARQHPPPAPPSMEGSQSPGKLPAPASMAAGLPVGDLDAGLSGNPNRGASREKRFGLGEDWVQRLELEKHRHASVSGRQYFLVCPGSAGPGADGACGKTAYKLFWVLARWEEHRDAELAERWIASLDSAALARRSAEVSALVQRYGPIMGDERRLRCRQCLKMNYGKSPEASRRNNQRRKRKAARG